MDEINQNPTNQVGRKVIKLPRKKIIVGIIVLVVLVAGWLILKMLTSTFGVGPTQLQEEQIPCIPGPGIICPEDGYSVSSGGIGSPLGNRDYKESSTSDYYRGGGLISPQYQEPTIEDTREFLKVSYSSSIETRKVQKTVTNIKNIVAGVDGRVDSFNSNEKNGYVRFVVAKDKFEDLREQIEKLTHKKLYTENVSAENLLGQKQGIEEQTTTVLNNLESYKKALTDLTSSHTQTVSWINKQLTSIRSQLTSVRASIAITTDTTILANLRYQESLLMSQESAHNTRLATENKDYLNLKENYEWQINNWNSDLNAVNKQDAQFTNNIETVNGYVRVSWISYWQLVKVFSPIHPTFIIIILIIIAGALLRRKRFIPKVVIE